VVCFSLSLQHLQTAVVVKVTVPVATKYTVLFKYVLDQITAVEGTINGIMNNEQTRQSITKYFLDFFSFLFSIKNVMIYLIS